MPLRYCHVLNYTSGQSKVECLGDESDIIFRLLDELRSHHSLLVLSSIAERGY